MGVRAPGTNQPWGTQPGLGCSCLGASAHAHSSKGGGKNNFYLITCEPLCCLQRVTL